MIKPGRILFVGLFLSLFSLPTFSQQKQLTNDDIFDPVKRVNFSGTTPNIRWLKDGSHYLLASDPASRELPRLQKVNAASGEAVAFFDAAKMQAALSAIPGITAQDARQLSNRSSYQLNRK